MRRFVVLGRFWQSERKEDLEDVRAAGARVTYSSRNKQQESNVFLARVSGVDILKSFPTNEIFATFYLLGCLRPCPHRAESFFYYQVYSQEGVAFLLLTPFAKTKTPSRAPDHIWVGDDAMLGSE